MNAPTAAAIAQRATGPIVWLDMDQQALDDAYDQLVYAPNRDQLTQRRIINSAAARKRIGDPLRCAYGPSPDLPPSKWCTASPMKEGKHNERTDCGGHRAKGQGKG